MTSNGGLSRRRVPGGGSSATSVDDDSGPTPRGSWSSPNTINNSGNGTSSPTAIPSSQHAGSAFEGGSKIAFDPRDLERDNEDQRQGGRAPRLTIMEEVLLLGLKDKQVGFKLLCVFRSRAWYLVVPLQQCEPCWNSQFDCSMRDFIFWNSSFYDLFVSGCRATPAPSTPCLNRV
jgi:hypothetical protein